MRKASMMVAIGWCFLSGAGAWAAEAPVPETVSPGATLVELYAAESFFEGPTWDPKTGKLYFTSFPEGKPQQILRLDGPGKVAVWMDDTKGVNGTYLSLEGRLLGAQAYGHHVVSYGFGENGPADPIDLIGSDTWNQPNDVCQTPNGDIYFTDPDFKNRTTSKVFRLSAGGELGIVIDDMPVPNGVIASNDGKTLYVGDSHLVLWRSYPIREDGTLGAGKVFFDPDTENRNAPDGMSIDEQGNLYFAGRGGVWVATPEGKALGLIAIPEFCSNVTFGGSDGKTLYFTCSNKVYSLQMQVRGGQFRARGAEGGARN
jgi:gluconolactonase